MWKARVPLAPAPSARAGGWHTLETPPRRTLRKRSRWPTATMEVDDEAMKVRENQQVWVQVQRSLNEAEELQTEPPAGGPGHEEEGGLPCGPARSAGAVPGGDLGQAAAQCSRTRCWTMMAVLAPIQEGMQSLPDAEVASVGATLRKVNLERFRAKLRDQYLEGKSADTTKAIEEAMGSIQEAQRIQDNLQFCLAGGAQAGVGEGPLLPPGAGGQEDIKEKYIPFIQLLRELRNPMPAIEAPQ